MLYSAAPRRGKRPWCFATEPGVVRASDDAHAAFAEERVPEGGRITRDRLPGRPGLHRSYRLLILVTDVGPMLCDNTHPSGRVDLVRTGNTVTAATRRVAELTLLISPEAFDVGQSIKVVANGRTVFDGRVEPSLPTLLKWAARDNDCTMLFTAELRITLMSINRPIMRSR